MSEASYAGAEAALAEKIAAAYAAGETVEIAGGGTRRALGRPVKAVRRVSTTAITGISLYEPGALTLVAGAGTPLAEVEAALAAEGQRLAFEPMDHRGLLGAAGEPTIGAVAAINNSGPRRIQAGAARDAMLGVRFIDGRGDVIRNGGRVMKNVTGYDLVKLLAGSWGVLGVVTEVALKVLPTPESEATLALDGLSEDAAVAALAAALGSPYDVGGAAHVGGRTLIRIEGFEAQVAHRAPALAAALKEHGSVEIVKGEESAALWRAVRDVEAFHGRAGAVWRISVKPSDGPGLAAELREKLELDAQFDWAGGLVWLLTPEAGDAGAGAIRAATAVRGGHATLVRADAATRTEVGVFEPEVPPVAALSARVKAAFDPRGILNPGRMRG